MAKISFYTHSIAGGTTADICDRVNKDIFDAIGVGDTGFYVTVFFCIYDTNTGKLQYTNGGHHKGIIIRKDSDQQEELDTQGFFIGSFEGAEYEYDEAYLGEGDKLILYTDGIVELRNPDGEFYEEIFYKRLSEKNELSPQELVNSIFEEMEEFRKDYPIKDDSTLLVIETNTVPHPAPDKEKKTVSSEKKESPEQDKRFVDAIKLFNQKKFTPELEKEIDSLLEKPKAPDILYYMKGVLLAKKGQFKEALKYFEKSREVNSNHVPTLNYLGFVHFKLKDYQRAADYWKKVLEINPDMKSAQKNLDVVNKLL
jgi:tetratricopeptide (TPR) repeat protein